MLSTLFTQRHSGSPAPCVHQLDQFPASAVAHFGKCHRFASHLISPEQLSALQIQKFARGVWEGQWCVLPGDLLCLIRDCGDVLTHSCASDSLWLLHAADAYSELTHPVSPVLFLHADCLSLCSQTHSGHICWETNSCSPADPSLLQLKPYPSTLPGWLPSCTNWFDQWTLLSLVVQILTQPFVTSLSCISQCF